MANPVLQCPAAFKFVLNEALDVLGNFYFDRKRFPPFKKSDMILNLCAAKVVPKESGQAERGLLCT